MMTRFISIARAVFFPWLSLADQVERIARLLDQKQVFIDVGTPQSFNAGERIVVLRALAAQGTPINMQLRRKLMDMGWDEREHWR